MLAVALRTLGRVHLVMAVLALTVLTCLPVARTQGDRLQIALPMLAWACAITQREGTEFAIRFFGMLAVAHGSKAALGDAPINQRPDGGGKGFPSAHTSAAALGASALVHDCIAAHPVAKAAVVVAAAFVGGSRIEAGKHDIWQVLAGGLLGWGADRLLRGPSPMRTRVVTGGKAIARRLTGGLLHLRRRALRAALAASLALGSILAAFTAQAEVELSLYGGVQTAPHSTVTHSTLGPDYVKWQGKSFEMPPYWGLRATWWRDDRLGLGLEVNHAKVYADSPAALGYDRLELTDGLNILTANVWRRWQHGGPVTPYVGAGIGLAIPHVEVQPTGQALTFGYQVTGPAVQLVAGASWRLNPRWSAFGEYKGTYSSHRMKLDSGGTLRTNIITNALNIGLSYRF